jgi:hypothetical protein
MPNYSNLAATATRLITKFGQSITVTNFAPGAEDVNTGISTQEATTFTTVGVLLDFDYRNFGETSESYHQVSKSDKRILLSASKVINAGDLIFIDNTIYKAYVIKCVNPAAVRIVYDIWAQK